MPRLQILQHKSYHPYLEKNKQRVREDEAKAREEELEKEQARVDKEAEARLDTLRRRAGSPSLPAFAIDQDDTLPSTSSTTRDQDASGGANGQSLLERHRKAKLKAEKMQKKTKDRLDFDFPSETARRDKGKERKQNEDGRDGRGSRRGKPGADSYDVDESGREAIQWESNGHLNFFADLEKAENGPGGKGGPILGDVAKSKPPATEKLDPYTMYLSRPERETKPWYTDRELKRVEDKEVGEEAESRRARDQRKDARSKKRHDPLTDISSLLSTHPSSSSTHRAPPRRSYPSSTTDPNTQSINHSTTHAHPPDPHAARINREKSERQRALDLIAKTQRKAWDNTPSTISGGDRSWSDSLEREKDRAGRRFFGKGSWEV